MRDLAAQSTVKIVNCNQIAGQVADQNCGAKFHMDAESDNQSDNQT